MKIIKHEKKGQPVEYYKDDWSVKRNKTTVTVFVKGKGRVKLRKNNVTEMEIEVAEKWTWAEIRRIWDEYGCHVAYEYCCKHLPCAETCVRIYLTIVRDVVDAGTLDEIQEKTGFGVYKGAYSMAVYGLFVFPIIEFDDHLKKEHGYNEDEHGSMRDFITDKWGEEFVQRLENLWVTSSTTKESQKQLQS